MFPKGLPGAALAVMRVALGLGFAQARWQEMGGQLQPWLEIAVLLLFAGLALGFFMPLMCMVCAIAEMASWLVGGVAWQQAHACTVLNALGLAMLGPGAYSLDAYAFGRRKVFLPRRGASTGRDDEG